jgi:hypothetical protein
LVEDYNQKNGKRHKCYCREQPVRFARFENNSNITSSNSKTKVPMIDNVQEIVDAVIAALKESAQWAFLDQLMINQRSPRAQQSAQGFDAGDDLNAASPYPEDGSTPVGGQQLAGGQRGLQMIQGPLPGLVDNEGVYDEQPYRSASAPRQYARRSEGQGWKQLGTDFDTARYDLHQQRGRLPSLDAPSTQHRYGSAQAGNDADILKASDKLTKSSGGEDCSSLRSRCRAA